MSGLDPFSGCYQRILFELSFFQKEAAMDRIACKVIDQLAANDETGGEAQGHSITEVDGYTWGHGRRGRRRPAIPLGIASISELGQCRGEQAGRGQSGSYPLLRSDRPHCPCPRLHEAIRCGTISNALGDSVRGATWISLHNGGGVGWGDVMNGGFGLVLDGSEEADNRAEIMLNWDVSNGFLKPKPFRIARRSWSGNSRANEAIARAQRLLPGLEITLPSSADAALLDTLTGRSYYLSGKCKLFGEQNNCQWLKTGEDNVVAVDGVGREEKFTKQ